MTLDCNEYLKDMAAFFSGASNTRQLLFNGALTHANCCSTERLHTPTAVQRSAYTHQLFFNRALTHTNCSSTERLHAPTVLQQSAFTHQLLFNRALTHANCSSTERLQTPTDLTSVGTVQRWRPAGWEIRKKAKLYSISLFISSIASESLLGRSVNTTYVYRYQR